jgi:hypothetical protein
MPYTRQFVTSIYITSIQDLSIKCLRHFTLIVLINLHLVAFNTAIRVLFNLENPLVADNIVVRRARA